MQISPHRADAAPANASAVDLVGSAPSIQLALEPRFVLDGAAAATAAGADSKPHDHQDSASDGDGSDAAQVTGHDAAAIANASATVEASSDGASAVSGRTIALIDTRIADYGVIAASQSADTEIIYVDAGSDGLALLSAAISDGSGTVTSVEIYAHGGSDELVLGSRTLDSTTIGTAEGELASWRDGLSADADILIYTCDLAATDSGRSLVDSIAAATGADVAASTDATGAATAGGDWTLEYSTGVIEHAGVAPSAFAGLLAATAISDTASAEPRETDEDSALTITGLSLSDGDDPAAMTLRIQSDGGTALVTLAGTATISSGSNGSADFTLSGSLADLNATIASFTFTPTADQNNTLSGYDPQITLTARDVSNNDSAVSYTLDNITVKPINDAPAIDASTVTPPNVYEGGSVSFTAATTLSGTPGFTASSIGLTDIDNTANQVIIKIAELPSSGQLTLDGNALSVGSTFAVSQLAQLTYTHDGSQVLAASTDSFKITIDDGAGGLLLDQNVTVNLLPANQAPAISGSVTVIEGEQDVSLSANGALPVPGSPERGAISASDPDDSSFSYAIVGLPSHGTLKYDGVVISSASAGSPYVISDLSLLTYSHDGSESPATDSFQIRITDAGGGTGTPATTVSTIDIGILDNNDDPVLTTNASPTLGSGSSITITSSMLQVTDVDSPSTTLTYTLTAIPDPADGYFLRDGTVLQVGSSFTQADIDAGLITYVTRSDTARTDSISFTVKDGEQRLYPYPRDGGIYVSGTDTLAVNTFNVIVSDTVTADTDPLPSPTPVSAAPSTGGSNTASLDEGATVTLDSTMLAASDSDNSAAEIVYRLLQLPSSGTIKLNGVALSYYGSFTQADVDAGLVSFVHAGGEDFIDSFTYTVSDGTSTTAVATFDLSITPQNDTPTASLGTPLTGTEGGTITIDASYIVLADADNSTSDLVPETGYAIDNVLSFRITGDVSHGTLKLDGAIVGIGSVISAADLAAGKLTYTHDGTENYSDSFTLVPLDNQGVTTATATNQLSQGSELTVPIALTMVNDAPVFVSKSEAVSGEAGPISEGGTLVILGATGYSNADGSGTPTAQPDSIAHLVYSDSDNTTEQRQYRITAAPSSGTLYLNGVALAVGSVFTQADLDAGRVSYKHNGSDSTSDYFDYVVSDGDYVVNDSTPFTQGSATTSSRFNISILSDANDKPTVSAAQSSVDVTATAGTAVSVPGLSVSDQDLGSISSGETDFLRVEISVIDSTETPVSDATLSYTAADPSTSPSNALVSGKGTNTLIVQGTKAEIDAILATLTVTYSTDADRADTLRVTVDDRLYDASGTLTGGANGGTSNEDHTPIDATNNRDSVDITLYASTTNDVPVLTNPSTYSANEDVALTLSGFTLSDADSFDKDVTVTVELYADAAHTTLASTTQGTLTINDTTGLSAWSGNGSNTVTLTGTVAEVQAALNALSFQTGLDYNNGPLYLHTTFTDWGHADNTGGNTVTVDNIINLVPVNDAPVLTVPGTQTLGSDSYIDIGGISFQDSKDTAQGASDDNYTVTIVAPTAGDQLAVTASGSVVVAGSGTGTLTLSGTRADINATLANNLRYTPIDPNGDNTYTLTVTVDDRNAGVGNGTEGSGIDGNNTTSATIDVRVSNTNEAPTLTVPAQSPSISEDSTANAITGITLSDSDDFGGIEQITLTVTHGSIDLPTHAGLTVTAGAYGSSTVTVQGTKADLNAALATLTYTPTADYHGSATLTVTANDLGNLGSGGAKTASQDVTITVNPVNDSPSLSGTTGFSTSEDSASAPRSAADIAGSLSYSDATDNQSGNGGGDTATAQTALAIVGNTASAAQGTWQYTLDGGTTWNNVSTSVSNSSAIVLDIANSDHQIRFVPAADFNGTPGTLSLRAADGTWNAITGVQNISSAVGGSGSWSASTATLTASVSPLNDAPSLTQTATSPTATENTSTGSGVSIDPVALLSAGTVIDVDLATTTGLSASVFGAGTLTVTLTDGVAGDELVLASGYTLPSGVIMSGGTADTPLTFTFDTDTTLTELNALLAALSYRNTSDNPTFDGSDTTRTYTIVLNDGNNLQSGGNAGGPAALAASTITGTITLVATNDPPTAVNDSNAITEDAVDNTVSGNVKPGTPGQDSDPDNSNAELTVSAVRTGAESGSGTAGTPGAPLDGQYGTLTLNPDGSYSYTLDNSNADVNALKDGDSLTETFTYTLSDGDGGSDTAELTITIHGHTDGAPAITPVDGNAGASGEASVYERGLVEADGSDATNGSIRLSTPDGLASITVGGTTVTLAQLQALGTTPIDIDTGEGTLRLDSFTVNTDIGGVPTDASLGYHYTLKTRLDQPGASESLDTIALVVTDAGNGSANGTLRVQIVDDTPTAQADSNTVAEEGTTVTTGNVVGSGSSGDVADRLGADLPANPVTQVGAGSGTPGTAVAAGTDSSSGSSVVGSFGTLTLGADGSYRYVLDTSNAVINALGTGDTQTDTFSYTITDADGDSSTTTLTITINGVNDAPTAVNDSNAITEDAVDNTVSGNVKPGTPGQDSDPDNSNAELTVSAVRTGAESGSGTAGTPGAPLDGQYGTLTLNPDGSYSYTLDNSNADVNALKDGDSLTETFTYTLSDGDGGSDTAELTITIHGHTDGAPAITPVDGNAGASGEASVYERGLVEADGSDATNGSIRLSTPDGLASITVGGTTVTLAQLQALGTTPIDIDTGEGTLRLDSFTVNTDIGGVPTDASLGYHYTLKTRLDQPGASESLDTIALVVTDAGNGSANGTLRLQIVNDTPTAYADRNTVAEEGTTVTTGNVVGSGSSGDVADRLGADLPANPVTQVGAGSGTPGTAVAAGT
ncbi:cadherin-like domain-containing protein, partial [Plasticicumulans acidivorans]